MCVSSRGRPFNGCWRPWRTAAPAMGSMRCLAPEGPRPRGMSVGPTVALGSADPVAGQVHQSRWLVGGAKHPSGVVGKPKSRKLAPCAEGRFRRRPRSLQRYPGRGPVGSRPRLGGRVAQVCHSASHLLRKAGNNDLVEDGRAREHSKTSGPTGRMHPRYYDNQLTLLYAAAWSIFLTHIIKV